MSTNTKSKLSNYNKTMLSIVIISAVTGGLVLLENYRKEQAVAKFTEELSHYKAPVKSYSDSLEQKGGFANTEDNSFSNTDAEQLAKIAEYNVAVDSPILVATQEETSLVKQVIEGQNNEPETLTTITNVDVLFGLSSAAITPEYKLALSKMAEQIKNQDNNKTWQLIGHTDKSGHVLYNLQLAKKRAQNVANFLIEQGVDEKQLKLVTLGEYEATQVATNSTYNKGLRRVEIVEYKPEVDALAVKLQKRFEKLEQQRIDKEQLAKINKVKNDASIDNQNDEKTVQFSLQNDKDSNEKTSVVLDSATGAKVLDKQTINDTVVLGNEPLTNNEMEKNEVAGVLSNYDL